MENIDVSIVLVSYNHEKFILEAIKSILKQKVKFTYEIIFADDCSTDNTCRIIKEYTKKVLNKTYMFSKKNHGNSYNVLNAYNKCRGKYIVTLEGDDYWYSNKKLQTLYDFLENNPDYIAVSNKRFTIDNNNNKIASYPYKLKVDEDINVYEFLQSRKEYSFVESMFKNIFKEHIIDFNFIKLIKCDRMIVDLPMCVYLLSLGKVRNLAKDFSVYRTICAGNTNSYTSTTNYYKIAENHINILNRMNSYFNYDFSGLYAKRIVELWGGLLINKRFKEYKRIKKLIPREIKFANLKALRYGAELIWQKWRIYENNRSNK